MTNRLPIQRCQYCGCGDIGLGWRMAKRWSHSGNTGCWAIAQYLICRRAALCSTSMWQSLTSILL
ncbi:MAG: hypothetical protein ACLRNW_12670 [Neglectibacter sp.]